MSPAPSTTRTCDTCGTEFNSVRARGKQVAVCDECFQKTEDDILADLTPAERPFAIRAAKAMRATQEWQIRTRGMKKKPPQPRTAEKVVAAPRIHWRRQARILNRAAELANRWGWLTPNMYEHAGAGRKD